MLRLFLAQVNATVGDIRGNYKLISGYVKEARESGSDLVIFPELVLTGYPPEDLLLKTAFIDENLKYIEKLKSVAPDIIVIAGFADSREGSIFNSAAVIYNNRIWPVYHKQRLPNYSVFDEERYFRKGETDYIFKIANNLVGLNICEDIFYANGPATVQSIEGCADLIINISASPYHTGKIDEREKMLATRAYDNRVNIAYVNLVGGQDELIFDGNSLILDEKGSIVARCRPFREDFIIRDIDPGGVAEARLKDSRFRIQKHGMKEAGNRIEVVDLDYKKNTALLKRCCPYRAPNNKTGTKLLKYSNFISCPEEEILEALMLGTRDYIFKNGFKKAVVALSGGIDSALVTTIASLAIGRENITAVLMPSCFSSSECIEDSFTLVGNLKINHMVIPITEIFESYLKNLKSLFKDVEINLTKENIQARIRGNIIMAVSNEKGWLVLSTGNKSEISVGYCTLYGDMAGGFSPIKDIYKTTVYSICRFINKKYNNIIPESIIARAPSAELKPGQKDRDSLPPYDILDRILFCYIEEDRSYNSIVGMGFDPVMVRDVINMVDRSEYKRRQASPGVKISARAFGKDRRYPVTSKFKLQ
ncbi:MAG: NAD+ synthase [Actinobacteria bacterium]|nr:NAD+ synthase [Actinomycetota bacterium]